MCSSVFVTYNEHNSNRRGFMEKDPGYVGTRANKDLWGDLCTKNIYIVQGAISLSTSKRKRGRHGKRRIDAEPTVLCAYVL